MIFELVTLQLKRMLRQSGLQKRVFKLVKYLSKMAAAAASVQFFMSHNIWQLSESLNHLACWRHAMQLFEARCE